MLHILKNVKDPNVQSYPFATIHFFLYYYIFGWYTFRKRYMFKMLKLQFVQLFI